MVLGYRYVIERRQIGRYGLSQTDFRKLTHLQICRIAEHLMRRDQEANHARGAVTPEGK